MLSLALRNLRQRTLVSAEEERVIAGLVSEVHEVRADQAVVRAGQPLGTSLVLCRGWMARSKDLRSGERQLGQLHVGGDFVDLHGFTLGRLDHDLRTLTPCTLATIPHERLHEVTEKYPRLTRILWFSTNIDAANHREWALSLGQRSAISRIAHLFCELLVRLEIVGLVDGSSYEFPLTQREISECLGLTVVHANRTIQELRRRELIELDQRRVTILDRRALEALAEFDPGYLFPGERKL